MRNPIITEDLATIAQGALPWSAFQGKRVLITGAGGFLPAYMVETLLFLNEGLNRKHPATVMAMVRDRDRALARFEAYRGRPDLELVVQDVCAPYQPAAPLHYIVHAASQASPKHFGRDPVGTLSANVTGTARLLELARTQPVESILYFSSGEVYGHVDPARMPVREDQFGTLDPTNVRSCYAESKRMGETMCASWAHQYQIPARIVRPFHTYGPGMRLDDGRVFADFVADVVHQRDIVLTSDGSAIRPFCYLTDATLGFFTVLLKGAVGQAYNIGNDQAEISIRDLASLVAGLSPGKPLQVIRRDIAAPSGYLASTIHRNCPDISKARALEWSPAVSLENGFRRTIGSFL